MNSQILRILRNLASMGVMRIVSAVLSFVLVVYIARSWGTLSLGEFSLALSYFFLLQQMPLLGLHIVLMRDIAAAPDTVNRHAVSASVLATGVSFILMLLLGVGGAWLYPTGSESLHISLWLVAISMIPTGFICVAESVLVGQQRMHVLALFNVLENIIRTLLSLLAIYLGYGMNAVFLLLLIGRILVAVGYFYGGGLRPYLSVDCFDKAMFKGYLKQIPTFVGIMLCAAGINRLDFILLSKFGSLQDLGLYSAPYKVYEVATMVPTLLMMVLFPAFAASFKSSRAQFESMFALSVRFVLLLGTPGVLLAVFYSQEIMLLFGAQYQHSYPALQWLLLSLIAAALIQLFSVVLLVTENQHLDFKTLAISCAGYALMLTISIPYWGFMGAAVSTFGVAILQTTIRFYFAANYLQLRIKAKVMFQTLTASLLMAGVLYLLRSHVIWAGIAGIVCYVVALFPLKAITAEHIAHFKGLIQSRKGVAT